MSDERPEPGIEERVRRGLAAAVEAGPDPRTRQATVGARLGEHRRHLDRRRQFLVGAAAVTVAAGAGVAWSTLARERRPADQRIVTGATTSTVEPGAERWEQISPAPLSPRRDPLVVWAGDRLVVWGGVNHPGPDYLLPPDGASWDLGSTGWQPTASARAGAIGGGFAVWDGSEVLVGVTEADSQAPWNADASEADARYGIAAYDPAADRWRYVAPVVPDSDERLGSRRQAVLVLDGALLVAVRNVLPAEAAHDADLVLVDPVSGVGRPVAPGPFAASPYADASGEVALAAVGDVVVAAPNWDLVPWVLDVASGDWRRVDGPPGSRSLHLMGGTPAGDVVLLQESGGPTLWAFDPNAEGPAAWRATAPNPEPRPAWGFDPVWSGSELHVPGAAYDPEADTWRPVEPPPRGPDRQRTLRGVWADGSLVLFGGEEHTCPDGASCDREPGPDTLDGWILRR